MRKVSPFLIDLYLSLGMGLVLGAAIGAFSPSPFWRGFVAAGLLAALCSFALIRLWRGMGESRSLAIIMSVAFLLRMLAGIVIMQVLPCAGYDTEVQRAGFVYSDAYERDTEAFRIASTGASLAEPFTSQLKSDQYGGLLAITALIYRIFSTDVARPLLITLLAAFTMTAGMAFLWNALLLLFNKKFARIALWILALYPESVLLGSSQMREPFLIGFACIAFWAVMQWQETPWKAFIVSAASVAGAILFSAPAGLIIAGISLFIFFLDWTIQTPTLVNRWTGIEILTILGFVGIITGWIWLEPMLKYSAYQTQASSGLVDLIVSKLGTQWTIPFVTVYGLLQPVLPAAIFDPSVPFWTILGIFRGLGWTLMLPFLLYAFFAVWKTIKVENGWLLIFANIIIAVWLIVSSARAGGDQWDNPRYRAILLPYMAILVAWVWQRVQQTRSRWFWRWVAVVGEFTILFSYWYASRKIDNIPTVSFFTLVAIISAVAVIILAGGAIYDCLKQPPKIVMNKEA